MDGHVQTSGDVIPFSSTGVTSFKVEMRKSTLGSNVAAADAQLLTDVAVDLVPLDGKLVSGGPPVVVNNKKLL